MQHKLEMIKQLSGFDIGKLGSTPKAMKMLKSKEKQAANPTPTPNPKPHPYPYP